MLRGLFAALTVALLGTPAYAGTFIYGLEGSLRGTVTSGSLFVLDFSSVPQSYDLAGRGFTINFSARLYKNDDSDFGYLFPKYTSGFFDMQIDGFDADQVGHIYADIPENSYMYGEYVSDLNVTPTSLDMSLEHHQSSFRNHVAALGLGADRLGNGFSNWHGSVYELDQYYSEDIYTISTNLAFTVTEADVRLSGFAPVPEPLNWALMIAGFGMVGAARRRTRRLSPNC